MPLRNRIWANIPYGNYGALEDDFDFRYSTLPHLQASYSDNVENKFSFSLNSIVYFYIEMHRLSSDSKWISRAVSTCQHIIDNNDEARVAAGSLTVNGDTHQVDKYFQCPYPYQANGVPVPGWSSTDGGNLRVQILQDGQVCAAICELSDYILDNALSSYTTKAGEFLDHIKRVIDSHENSWKDDKVSSDPPMTVQGAWYYPERINGNNTVYSAILPYNHAAGAVKSCLVLNKHGRDTGGAYLDKAERFIAFTRSNRETVGDRFLWLYGEDHQGQYEDLNHGSYTFDMMLWAKRNNYLSITDDELRKYTQSLFHAWKSGKVGRAAEKVNGEGELPSAEHFDLAHVVDLAHYDSNLYEMAKDLASVKKYSFGAYAQSFRAYACLLRYKKLGSLISV